MVCDISVNLSCPLTDQLRVRADWDKRRALIFLILCNYYFLNSDYMVKRGIYIAFEGLDGCGKTTQLRCLAERYQKTFPDRGLLVTKEPGGTESANQVREILLSNFNREIKPQTEVLLFAASRAITLKNVVARALAEGKDVLADRSVYSSMAYQGYARGIGMDKIKMVNDFATEGLLPDRVVLIDLPVEVALERIQNRGGKNRLDDEAIEFHKKVRLGFLELAEADPERFLVVDASLSIEAQHEQIWNLLLPLWQDSESHRDLGGEIKLLQRKER
jgi:dTMP kinase